MSKLLLTLFRTDHNDTLYLYKSYFNYFKQANIDLISVYNLSNNYLEKIIPVCDGLLLTGGKDVNPYYYNHFHHPLETYEASIIDTLEFKLIELFVKNNKTIIGICRGIQTINVYFQGTLFQHIQNHQKTFHLIYPVKESHLSRYIQPMFVNSYHHQSIKQLGKGLFVSAYSDDHGIEAIEGNKIIAFQWHPEKMNQFSILKMICHYLDEK